MKTDVWEGSAYRLTAVTDKTGNSKLEVGKYAPFYQEFVGFVSGSFGFDKTPCDKNQYRLNVFFTQNAEGTWINRHLHTSPVEAVVDTEKGFKVITRNSIYIFEQAELLQVHYLEEANLLELYLSQDSSYLFCKGFYYDGNSVPHELEHEVHPGMFQDSVLVSDIDEKYGYVCRYFPLVDGILFYDTLQEQPESAIPILIHNTGKEDLVVRFKFDERVWRIPSGMSERIVTDSDEFGNKKKHLLAELQVQIPNAGEFLLDYIVVCVSEFAKHYKMTMEEAYVYLRQNNGIAILLEFYDVEKIWSIEDVIEALADFCEQHGDTQVQKKNVIMRCINI